MPLAVLVLVGMVEAAQEIVGRDPTIQAFRPALDDLDVQVAVRERESGVLLEIGADLTCHSSLLALRK